MWLITLDSFPYSTTTQYTVHPVADVKVRMDEDRRILVEDVDEVDEADVFEDTLEHRRPPCDTSCLNIVYFSSIVAAIGLFLHR